MQKGLGILVAVVVAVIALGAFWMLRGQPAGEIVPTVSPTPTPTASPISGDLPGVVSSPTSPSIPRSGVTVSVTAVGFNPSRLDVPVNGTVTFVNNDTQSRQPSSEPHPLHTNYPPLNSPVLASGQSFTVTFTRAGTFGFHDHLNPGLRGTVTVR